MIGQRHRWWWSVWVDGGLIRPWITSRTTESRVNLVLMLSRLLLLLRLFLLLLLLCGGRGGVLFYVDGVVTAGSRRARLGRGRLSWGLLR